MRRATTREKSTVRVSTWLAGMGLVLLGAGASAQLLSYDNEDQLLGAAAASPDSVRQVLQRLVATCSEFGTSLHVTGERELTAWQHRHKAYLQESQVVRQQLQAKYGGPNSDPRVRDALRTSLEVTGPKIIDAQYESFAAPIKTSPSTTAKMEICRSYIQSIAERKWDLKTNDPTLSAFFDRRINAKAR